MSRTKKFASFALAACMGVSLLVNVPAGTVSAVEPDEVVTSQVEDLTEEAVPGATGTDAEALDEGRETVYNDASDADEDGFVWDGTTLVKYVGKGGDVVIPSKCTEIGQFAFWNTDVNLTSITIPASVTKIQVGISGMGISGRDSLTRIEVASGNTVYDSRENCNAIIETKTNTLIASCKNTIIPNDVTRIGPCAFEGNSLDNITIPEGVTYIGYRAFLGCENLESIVIPSSVTTIWSGAFEGCSNLTSITIPEGVTEIGSEVFVSCSSLTSITIPASATEIGTWNNLFQGCDSLTQVEVASGNTVYDSRENCNAIIETKTNTLISGCKNTKIPSSVTKIGQGAFFYCGGLTGIVIPKGVTEIEDAAFRGCDDLTSVSIPNTLIKIGGDAFRECEGLTSITIPNGVTEIGHCAFNLCSSLTSITIPKSVTKIGDAAFFSCHSLKNITIPAGVAEIGGNLFGNCNSLSQITVSDKNSVYDSREDCNAIIETATNKLIAACNNTKIPNNVTEIGLAAFENCENMTNLTIPASVTKIGYRAFEGCKNLTSIIIPESVTNIEDYTFSGCTNLKNITIPASVTKIGSYTFDFNDNLKTIYGIPGSYAETFAKEKGYEFIDVANKPNTGDTEKPEVVADVTTSYHTHVQKDGWQGFVTNGTMSGTSGQAKRLEGIEISVSGNKNLGIQYSTHCQTYGWLPWSANGEMNGTTGEAKRLEAIKIQLTGKDKDKYDVYYRVHAQSYGWLGWAKNGAPSGTAGYAKRLEGIQIVVVKKGAQAPGLDYAGVNASKGVKDARAYIAKTNGAITIPGSADNVNIMYKTHVQSFGWQNWVLNGAMSGTSGEAKRLEAIQIRLYGEMAEKYDVYYRVHAQSYGWLSWAKNGEESGTAGFAKRLEGIQIVLVPKGGAAPANNYKNIQSVNTKAYIKK